MADILTTLKTFLGLSPTILKWPFVLTNLIIPFIVFTYALKLVLDKLGMFRSDAINYGLAGLVSFSSIIFISALGPFILPASVFMIYVLKKGAGVKGIAIGFVLALVVFYGMLIGIGYVTSVLS